MVDTEIIKYLISIFENKIRTNPLTPEFAKLSYYYLINGEINKAIDLINKGLYLYPNYTTAKFILGKCFLASKYYHEAKKIFNEILADYPDLKIVQRYLNMINEILNTEVSKKYTQDVTPELEFKTSKFNESDFNYNLFPTFELDDVVNDLNYERFVSVFENSNEFNEFKAVFQSPYFFKRNHPDLKYEKKRLRNKFELKIITETLADIFAKQGNYFDALEAYSYLLKVKPERKEQLESKINEIELQIQKLITDF